MNHPPLMHRLAARKIRLFDEKYYQLRMEWQKQLNDLYPSPDKIIVMVNGDLKNTRFYQVMKKHIKT